MSKGNSLALSARERPSACAPKADLLPDEVLCVVASLKLLLEERSRNSPEPVVVSASDLGHALRVVAFSASGLAAPVVMVSPVVVTHTAEMTAEHGDSGVSSVTPNGSELFRGVTVKFTNLQGESCFFRADDRNGLAIPLQRCLHAFDAGYESSAQDRPIECSRSLAINS